MGCARAYRSHHDTEGEDMSSTLRDFASAASQSKRIRFGDLRRLKRDILPARITTREEVEVLIALDAVIERADREWRSYLIATVRDFVVWGLSLVGRVDRQKAEWLVAVLSSGVARKTARILAHEVAREAHHVDDTLVIFAAGRRRKSTLPAARLTAALPVAEP
jgi:hypothetical protein